MKGDWVRDGKPQEVLSKAAMGSDLFLRLQWSKKAILEGPVRDGDDLDQRELWEG